MRRTQWLQETRKMRFEEAYRGWQARGLTQEEAGRLWGVGERTFRRYVDRYEEAGLEGLMGRNDALGIRWPNRRVRVVSGPEYASVEDFVAGEVGEDDVETADDSPARNGQGGAE